jgi:hypothetical protein
MTRDDIIRMAREAGCIPVRHPEYDNDVQVFATPDELERFASLVAAAERKRIADIIRSDKYGIGNMCSQWTSDDVADDILEGQA